MGTGTRKSRLPPPSDGGWKGSQGDDLTTVDQENPD